MRVLLSSKSTQISDRQREYAEKKLGKLARYFNSARNANLTHSVQRNLHTVEVMVDLDGILVRAEERSPDFFASLDVAADRLEKHVRRLKERIAIESYSEIVRWLGNDDPTTRSLVESILKVEEEHAEDLSSLLDTLQQK